VVKRDGHCNITSAEELNAFRALVKWSESGKIVRDADGTIIAPSPQSVATFADGAATSKVTKLASGEQLRHGVHGRRYEQTEYPFTLSLPGFL